MRHHLTDKFAYSYHLSVRHCIRYYREKLHVHHQSGSYRDEALKGHWNGNSALNDVQIVFSSTNNVKHNMLFDNNFPYISHSEI